MRINNKELRMKILSTKMHTIIGLIVGLALLVAPWLFGFSEESGAVVTVPLLIGVFIIVSELTTTSVLSPLKIVPMKTHIIVDIFTGLLLVISPWLFSFSDLEANAWVPHVVVGLLVVGYALVTSVDDSTNTASE